MRSANGACSLARQYYRCPDIFDCERQRIFFRKWILLGRVDELFSHPDSGLTREARYHACEFVGAPLLMIQSWDGQLQAFHNVCRHRGAALVRSGCGQVRNGRLTCPYHAWSYDSAGKLVGAPNMQEVPGFRREEHGLRPLNVCERHGFVFVNFQEQSDVGDAPLQPLDEKLLAWKVGQLKIGASLKYQVQANWKLLFENYSECYHCPTVHPALNRLTPFRGSDNELLGGEILGGPMDLAEGVASMSSDGGLAASLLDATNEKLRRHVFYYTVFPNCFFSLHPDYVLIHRLKPVNPGLTEVHCEFLIQEIDIGNPRLKEAVEFWDLTNRQDWEMCERVQEGSRSPAFSPGPLSNLESVVAAFDQHYLQVIEDSGSAGPS